MMIKSGNIIWHLLLDFPWQASWVFWNLEDALRWIENATFPVVFKLKGGAGSANVVLIKNKQEAINVTRKMFSLKGVSSGKIPHNNNLTYLRDFLKLYGLRRFIAEKRGRLGPEGRRPYWQIQRDYVFFQKFFPNNQYDQRVTVIGKRAFSFLRYTRPNDFRASGSGLIEYDIEKNHKSCIKIAFEISKKNEFSIHGI
jgi:glutathione synthase/RimK-type ligase-like ATP-grasp enzyme